MNGKYKRGEFYFADLDPVIGSEQGGIRPVLILQNNKGNKHSDTMVVAVVTSKMVKPGLPTHVLITSDVLEKHSTVMLEQIRCIDKRRILEYIGRATKKEMFRVETALLVCVGMGGNT